MSERKFQFNGRVTVFSLICFVVFINLGFWQLSREEEKRTLIAERQARDAGPALAAEQLETQRSELDGLRLRLDGSFLSEFILLLDNVVLEGRVGFEVLQLFRANSGRHFLVNRGFVSMGRTRDDKVEVPALEQRQVRILGKVYVGDGAPLQLSDVGDSFSSFPVIVQRVDIPALASQISKDIFPHVIRLEEGQHGALPRFWPDTVMPPEKHRGYAIQWFMMATAVLIAWLFFSFPKPKSEEENE